MTRDVVVLSAMRTAVGTFGGTLRDTPLTHIATVAVKGALEQSRVPANDIGHVVMGNVIPTDTRDAYLSRVAALDAGLSIEVPAFNVNRLCGSGLQAIVSAAQAISLADCDFAVGAGAEAMSRGPYITPHMRWGTRLGDVGLVDYMNGILHDPWQKMHMGITAENVAKRYHVNREAQDELAAESQRRAAQAIAEGRFKGQIVPIEVEAKRQTLAFTVDEHPRASVTVEGLAAMSPVFQRDGTVTAGNSSGLNDGAAALVLAEAGVAQRQGLKPLARFVGYAHAGVDPAYMGMGPVPATLKLLERTGLKASDLDVIESNEAFASQACAVIKELDLDPVKVNPNGSGISLGHPVGATGAIISVKAIHELHRAGGRYALVTMCIGGGQGIAAIFERM